MQNHFDILQFCDMVFILVEILYLIYFIILEGFCFIIKSEQEKKLLKLMRKEEKKQIKQGRPADVVDTRFCEKFLLYQ